MKSIATLYLSVFFLISTIANAQQSSKSEAKQFALEYIKQSYFDENCEALYNDLAADVILLRKQKIISRDLLKDELCAQLHKVVTSDLSFEAYKKIFKNKDFKTKASLEK